LLPGVRDLGSAAAVYLYVTDVSLDYREVWFVMKLAGYRAEEVSIYYALRRAEDYGLVTRTWGGSWRRPTREELPEARVRRLLGVRGQDFDAVLERTAEQLERGLAERRRRLRG
jgi:DNA-binding PadR family transcriptional regulator